VRTRTWLALSATGDGPLLPTLTAPRASREQRACGPSGARRAAVDVPEQQRPFRARAGAREQIEDLARCEPVCCPFVEYGVETTNDEVIFT
jgi:hypothetical protein